MGPRRKRVKEESADDDAPPVKTKPTGKSVRMTIEEKLAEKKNVAKKAAAPVDEFVPNRPGYEVVVVGKDVWSCLLNQTNVGNNNNKYYIIQLLRKIPSGSYHVWNRWGRVGYKGQNSMFDFGSNLEAAQAAFEKKFTDKTKNDWSDRANFEHVHGKYDLLQVEEEVEQKEEVKDAVDGKKKSKSKKTKKEVKEEAEEEDEKPVESKLPPSVQEIMGLIFDLKAMEQTLSSFKFDIAKAPLGKLTTEQLRSGYLALARIDELVSSGKLGQELTLACNEYYTRIPHYFGMKTPPLIRTEAAVRAELDLLECLGDIEIAMQLESTKKVDVHPVDSRYESLRCDLQPLDRDSEEFQMVDRYLTTNHAGTHNVYSMVLVNAFKVKREAEDDRFKDYGNNALLWHGSRLTNYAGILSSGLRIAPPEAPSTGYMFGKGIYFADMSSKSANYCYTTRSKNTGLVLLSQVSLGKTNDLVNADYEADKTLPKGKHSVKGLGMIVPDPKSHTKLEDGTVVPIGKGVDSKRKNLVLNYNEYIVYDVSQVKMKYLLQVEFKYK